MNIHNLTWYPAQRSRVETIIGQAVISVCDQGRPVNVRTLLDLMYVQLSNMGKREDIEGMMTAISILENNQDAHAKE
ncbi:hypothetical protein BIY26_03285 [Brenneria goodwinii]|uniref:Uncharacterized protein n=1 Tax=Brenneria goodwinii TaxID=1109412 RepID=A0A0G4JQZ4_9GAMM|nr:hypothetical protein [Brenneria goodwinii]ATA25292.1 hypothetical protein AWC36_14840 [Brenneria goodwinii]MCG8158716.1 hypothetical protein [Brenneria goodwinii]MCG8162937.1 hypothetical protein [Brenneria goodwinii]MCG8167419.1 hypothetical protein [Brenneria goodwinii]MCG8172078.1 hypothetical protein [Brenneria goodwinii]